MNESSSSSEPSLPKHEALADPPTFAKRPHDSGGFTSEGHAPRVLSRGGIGDPGPDFTPHLIIFISSACVMVVELVAGRLIARHLGSSLYTWTSIIGVVLAGMSVGNYVGGRMADRWKPEVFLGWLFMLASITCVFTLGLNHLFFWTRPLDGLAWPTRVFLSVLCIFICPALALGTISPVTAKMALDRSQAVGATIGSVYAWGAIGSILGTFSTGFWLISAMGSKAVVLVVALGLALVGWWRGPMRVIHAVWVLVVAGALMLTLSKVEEFKSMGNRLGLREALKHEEWSAEENKWLWHGKWDEYPFAQDSDYQFVKVSEQTSEHDATRNLRMLSLDYLRHGYVDLKDSGFLEYKYEKVYRDVARRFAEGKKQVAAFFIGGGSYTFPRWVQHEWPGSSVDVAEIDPLVTEANHVALGLARDTPIRTVNGDARNTVDDLPPDRAYDLIFGDAFNDLSVPWHLTTLEFSQKIAAHVTPDGAYLVNIIDDFESGLFVGAFIQTLRRTFRKVYVFTTEKEGVKRGRETFVVAASQREIDVSDWSPGHDGSFPGSVLSDENLEELARKSGGRMLTDDYAPVENLLEPVVRTRK